MSCPVEYGSVARKARPRTKSSRSSPVQLSGLFSAPQWLRDLGISAWLLFGVGAALVGRDLAAVADRDDRDAGDHRRDHRRGRRRRWSTGSAPSASPVGSAPPWSWWRSCSSPWRWDTSSSPGSPARPNSLSSRLQEGADQIESWAHSLGVKAPTAADANAEASASISAGFQALTHGVLGGVDKLASLAVFLSFTALSLFFLLKDGPQIGAFVERHLGVPVPVAHSILGRVAGSMRGYFLGVTIVAAWSALIVGVGSLVLGRPAGGDDRRRHLPRRLRPLHRRLDRGRLRGPDRARRLGPGGGGGDGGHRPARQRRLPAAGPADRLRRGAEAAPAGGADRDDRRRLPVRDRRPGAGGAAPLGRGEDLCGPHRGRGGGRGEPRPPPRRAAIPPSGRSAGR